jgi:glucose-1-phosphate thymidylyltransferase
MKGIILAGGFGTRLEPLTHVVNKNLLPVYNRPMINYPLETLIRSGISDVCIVAEESQVERFKNFFNRNGTKDITFSFRAQKEAPGIAHALGMAEDFASGESVAVILGDNIFEDDFARELQNFASGAKIFLKSVPDPERFGIAVMEDGRVMEIEEKPSIPKSNHAVVGFYLFDRGVFDIIKTLKPSGRGELEITDAINIYARKNELEHAHIRGFWIDAGTFDSLLVATMWASKRNGSKE